MIKNLRLSLVVLFLSHNVFSQPSYHKMLGDSNLWYVSGHGIGVKPSGSQNVTSVDEPCIGYYEANEDSLYNGFVYKKFKYNIWGGLCFSMSGNSFQAALVREDTVAKQIYVIPENSSAENLVMDFSLNVNDQIYLSFGPNSWSNPLFDDNYIVDSIKNVPEMLGLRRHFYLSSNNAPIDPVTGNKYYVEWIESIGAKHFPVSQSIVTTMLNNGINPACPKIQYSNFVTCKFTDGVKYYQDSCALNYAQTHPSQGYIYFGNDCEFYSFAGKVKNLSFLSTLELFPNPTSTNDITIKFTAAYYKPIELSIYNALGQKVFSDMINITESTNEIKLDDLKLQQGLYSLHMKSEDESSSINFIRN